MTKKETFVKELLENLPEYAVSFDCHGWNYERCEFSLTDNEDGKEYTLTLALAVKGFDKLCNEIDAGKFPGLSLPAGYKSDGSYWDSRAVDALLQMAVLGAVIYG